MQSLAKEVRQELTERIVPFWEGLRDEEYGGFYGYQDFDLNVQKTYEKGCILNSRILWFFSNAYLTLKDEKLRADAVYIAIAGAAYTVVEQQPSFVGLNRSCAAADL